MHSCIAFKNWVLGNFLGQREGWGCFASETRKTPPHTRFTTQSLKEPYFSPNACNEAKNPIQLF